MSITWNTNAGNLGWIPDSVFFQITLLASVPTLGSLTVTATEVSTNRITCSSTTGLVPKQSIIFNGTTFGNIVAGTEYYVKEVISSTEFTISTLPFSSGTVFELTTASGSCTADFADGLYYEIVAGTLPEGIQCAFNGVVSGVPDALASLQGIPLPVGANKTFKWTVRAYTENLDETVADFADRTFELTIVVSPGPNFVTPAGLIGTYYDSDEVDFQFQFTEVLTDDDTVVELVSGQLPGGLTLEPSGLLTGYIQPTPDIDSLPGYAQSGNPYDTTPYDFVSQFLSKNFQFQLRVTNGKKSNLRTFEIFVYSRDQMSADDDVLVDNNTFITASESQERAPFIINESPSNLGIYRSQNYFAYRFIGQDYDSTDIRYAISVNSGFGFAPGLTLDNLTGWYYGYIPDQGATENTYSFNIVVYQATPVTPAVNCFRTLASENGVFVQGTGQITAGQPIIFASAIGGLTANTIYYVDTVYYENIVPGDPNYNTTRFTVQGQTVTNDEANTLVTLAIEVTATSATNNRLTTFSTNSFEAGQPIVFSGTAFGGISTDPDTVYYVHTVNSSTQFTVALSPSAATPINLTTDTGSMLANMIVASREYPYSLTITGALDAEVTWITDSDLGVVDNGSTSILKVEAENRGGRVLAYRLLSGSNSSLPQGLKLLPSGDIAGRISFDTFSLDLGTTTFDESLVIIRSVQSLGTTFDSTFTFTVNAYAPENVVPIYSVSSVSVVNGGSGYSSINTPTIEISAPIGATAVQATVGNVTVSGGAITVVDVDESGDGYTSAPTVTVTQGFGGSGAVLAAVLQRSGSRDVVSANKTFSVRVYRRYNKPYQNLYIRAMPPQQDRAIIRELLDNEDIFVPEYIFRPDDANFGKSSQVTYYHAYGLDPDNFDTYVASLYENHYFKNLILGQISTAQALDSAGNVIYEVVYSKIIDTLVNDFGESVSKIVNLPYTIIDPQDGSTLISQVYPNSLINMRNQVIDVVGQISSVLPAWMTSKQTNGRVLGFTPAWVICYTKPGRSAQIAYYIQTQFAQDLNIVDFTVDRYILDRILSKNWDTETQRWTPTANLTTFDRFDTGALEFIGTVDYGTNLAFADVNNRSLAYINNLGGLDGVINLVENKTIIFARQEDYNGLPDSGSVYATTNEAWTYYEYPFDSGAVDGDPGSFDSGTFDQSYVVPGGDPLTSTQTIAASDTIVCNSTSGLRVDQPIQFTSGVFGGLVTNQIYFVRTINSATTFTVSETQGGSILSLNNASGTMVTKPANLRMAIYRMNLVDNIIRLTLIDQTYAQQYLQVTSGNFYRSSYLYYPGAPGAGLSRVSWLPVVTVVTDETIFDGGSLAFIEPVDMYDTSDSLDKYLVFPKQNILA